MKTLVTRSLALLLTLALLFTVTPFTALAEAAENEDGMDEIMDILETYAEETETSVDSGEALADSTEETAPTEDASDEDRPIDDDSEETEITDEQTEASDLPDTPEEEIILDDPGVEDDWADWYTDDQPEEESEEAGDDWPETDDALSEEDAGEDAVQPLTLEEEIAQLYDGSYIKYAIEQAGHAYVTTKGTATKVYGWVPFVVIRLVDNGNPDKLIAVGAAILIAGIAADNVNLWLKQAASRPRYKYLITLEYPKSEFRSWWQMIPNLAGSNDNFKSWPSGNMTIASMMFSLPMLTDVMKKRSNRKNLIAFILGCVFVLIYGYNRIHMTNHFLSDVCFGTLITYLIYSLISTAFLRIVSGETDGL